MVWLAVFSMVPNKILVVRKSLKYHENGAFTTKPLLNNKHPCLEIIKDEH